MKKILTSTCVMLCLVFSGKSQILERRIQPKNVLYASGSAGVFSRFASPGLNGFQYNLGLHYETKKSRRLSINRGEQAEIGIFSPADYITYTSVEFGQSIVFNRWRFFGSAGPSHAMLNDYVVTNSSSSSGWGWPSFE